MADPEEMDEAAKVAEKEFREDIMNEGTADDMLLWWKKHFSKAGHRRLGRLAVKLAKEVEAKN